MGGGLNGMHGVGLNLHGVEECVGEATHLQSPSLDSETLGALVAADDADVDEDAEVVSGGDASAVVTNAAVAVVAGSSCDKPLC